MLIPHVIASFPGRDSPHNLGEEKILEKVQFTKTGFVLFLITSDLGRDLKDCQDWKYFC